MKDYKKICGWFFFASPSRALNNCCTGGCVLGYRGIMKMCKKCDNYNTRNFITEGYEKGKNIGKKSGQKFNKYVI